MGLVYAWENMRQGRNSGGMGGNTEKRKTNPRQRRRGNAEAEEKSRFLPAGPESSIASVGLTINNRGAVNPRLHAGRIAEGVEGGADEDDDGGELHPDDESDGGGEAAVGQRVRDAGDVEAESGVDRPPEHGGQSGAGEDLVPTAQAWAAGTVECGDDEHGHEQNGGEEESAPDSVNQRGESVALDEPGASLHAEDGQDDGGEPRDDSEKKKEHGADVASPESGSSGVAGELTEAVHEEMNGLGAGEKKTGEAEDGPVPGVTVAAGKEVNDDLVRPGRECHSEPGDDVFLTGDRAGGNSEESQDEQEHREKGEEHVEGDGLGESRAAAEGQTDGAAEGEEKGAHGRWDYTEVDSSQWTGTVFNCQSSVVRKQDAGLEPSATQSGCGRVCLRDNLREVNDGAEGAMRSDPGEL